MILKVGIIIVIAIALFAATTAVFNQAQPAPKNITSGQAQQLVLTDVRAQNPSAVVSIVNVSPSTLVSGSWNIFLVVIYNATRPCPTLFIESFDYPATQLLPTTDNLYTSHCVVNEPPSTPSYVISSPYIASARSYNASSIVRGYVSTYGYNETVVHATFYQSMNASVTPLNVTAGSVWLVNFSAGSSGYNQYVLLSQAGRIIGNYTASKQ